MSKTEMIVNCANCGEDIIHYITILVLLGEYRGIIKCIRF